MKEALKKIGSKIFELLEYYFKKLIDYKFRKRSVFWWGIKYVTISLIAELICAQTESQFSYLFNWVNSNYGKNWEVFSRTFIDLILAGGLGYTYITIFIKLYLISLFSILEWNKDNGFSFQWKNIWIWNWNWNLIFNIKVELNLFKFENNYIGIDWEPTDNWFSDINKNQLSSIKKKYNKDLHIASKIEDDILSSIRLSQNELHILNEKVDKTIKNVIQLETEIDELFRVNTKQEILVLNVHSEIYTQLNDLKADLTANRTSLQKLKEYINNSKAEDVKKYVIPALLEISFNIHNINQIINENRFDLLIKKEDDGTPLTIPQKRSVYNFIYPTYSSYNNLTYLISQIEILRNKIFDNFYLIQAKAGIGKTHFSINLERILSKENFKTIFIPGSSFSGIDNLHIAFKSILELPDNVTFESALKKINEFSEKLNTKTIIIIDGINETTNLLQGFSTIWNDNLETLCSRIHQYNNLVLVITCRETYLKKINLNIDFDNNIFQLEGFEDDIKRLQAIEKYFEHYNIICSDVRRGNPNLDFFELPLILSIFCEMTNPDKSDPKIIQLGQYTYEEVLKLFVDKQSEKVAKLLDRPSKTPILNAIDRSSEKFKTEIDASLNFDEFLSATDNKSIDDILESKSIGIKLIEEELLFLKEYLPGYTEERVKHIFQNIGGYLIAKNILNEFARAKDLVDSGYYKNYLNYNDIDKENKTHQLVTDILKFLVIGYSRKKQDLINYTEDQLVINYTWEFLFENPEFEEKEDVLRKLKPFLKNRNGWKGLLDKSIRNFINPTSSFNMLFISEQLKELTQFQSDLTWTRFIFDKSYGWDEFLDEFFEDNEKIEVNKAQIISLKLVLVIWLLETTSRNLRDKASLVLLEYATQNPKFIFEKVFEYSTVKRTYIYERLASICYGVCLRKQNDNDFINGLFKEQIQRIYKLQFGKESTAPTYNYIVIDSIKHIVDLAIYKGIFTLEDPDLTLLKNYKFNTVEQWPEISKEDKNYVGSIVRSWHDSANSDPFKGDFVHYTIPRLQERGDEGPDIRLTATANIYKRLIELGYVTEDKFKSEDNEENDFYFGHKPYGIEGKVDRLGKKYSWMAFFDYAGNLINNGLLNVWYENDGGLREYNRLGDVGIEVSNPTPIIEETKLFNTNLLEFKNDDPKWTERPFYEESKNLWKHHFEEGDFTLLNGYVEQRLDKSYDVRSYLLIESFLVKTDDIKGQEEKITGNNYDWINNIHTAGSFSNVYFGELYWADNVQVLKRNHGSIPIEMEEEIKYTLTMRDIIISDEYSDKKAGDEVTETVKSRVNFEVESTIYDYLWESDSKIFISQRTNIPSPNIGKYLNLKSDPTNLQILAEDGSLAFKSVEFEDPDLIKQELDYLRTNLLKKYMEDKGLVLMYQIKQHTYDRLTGDRTGDFRGMQFFFPHLNE